MRFSLSLSLSLSLSILSVMALGCDRGSSSESSPSVTSSALSPESPLGLSLSTPLPLPLGRVTALDLSERELTLGHESGTISVWRWEDSSLTNRAPIRQHIWFAHEGAVRTLKRVQRGVGEPEMLLSVGAGGSWALWSQRYKMLRRLRAGDAYTNRVIADGEGGWLIAGARGLVARWRDDEVWRGVGEHGRAAFDLGLFDPRRVLSVGSDGALRCWELARGESCGVIRVHQGWAVALRRVRDSWISAGSDGRVKSWSSPQLSVALNAHRVAGAEVTKLALPKADIKAHDRDITSLDTRGRYVLSGSELGGVTLLELKSGGELNVVWRLRSDDLAPVLSVALDLKRGRALIGGGQGGALVWSVELKPTVTGPPRAQPLL